MDNGPMVFIFGMIMFFAGMWVGVAIGRVQGMADAYNLWKNRKDQ